MEDNRQGVLSLEQSQESGSKRSAVLQGGGQDTQQLLPTCTRSLGCVQILDTVSLTEG
jgi:hypothetical protein